MEVYGAVGEGFEDSVGDEVPVGDDGQEVPLNVIRAVAPRMKEAGGGSIVLMAG